MTPVLGFVLVVDALFEHPRLVAVYDSLEGNRGDLDAYIGILDELGASVVLDVGCGTGTFALRLAQRGLTVIGVDPARESLRYARSKPRAEKVTWIDGDATTLPPLQVDAATMTGNVAQAIVDEAGWRNTLTGIHDALRPGGHLIFETRDPDDRAWRNWTTAQTHRMANVAGVGIVEAWGEVTDVRGPLVTFVSTRVFATDGAVLTSTSTLRFRNLEQVTTSLTETGFAVVDVRDAPDRPGQELVLIAIRGK